MGGGTGTSSENTTVDRYSELTGAELGVALLNDYTVYLRAYDEHINDAVEANAAQIIAKKDLSNANTEIWTELVKIFRENPDATPESAIPDELSQRLTQSAVNNAFAFVARERANSSLPSYTTELLKWPTRKTVQVINVTDNIDIISPLKRSGSDHAEVYALRKRHPVSIAGKITNLEMHGDEGGRLRVTTRSQKSYEVGPLVDRKRGYVPNVHIIFVE